MLESCSIGYFSLPQILCEPNFLSQATVISSTLWGMSSSNLNYVGECLCWFYATLGTVNVWAVVPFTDSQESLQKKILVLHSLRRRLFMINSLRISQARPR